MKLADAPSMTKLMRIATEHRRLDRFFVVHPRRVSWRIDERTEALAILDLPGRLSRLASSRMATSLPERPLDARLGPSLHHARPYRSIRLIKPWRERPRSWEARERLPPVFRSALVT